METIVEDGRGVCNMTGCMQGLPDMRGSALQWPANRAQTPTHLGGQADALLHRQVIPFVTTLRGIHIHCQPLVQSWLPLWKSSKHSLFGYAVGA